MKKQLWRYAAALLLLTLLSGCGGAEKPDAAAQTAAPAAVQTEKPASQQNTFAETKTQPAPPSTMPDKNGYAEYAGYFYEELKKGDALACSAYLWFENEEERALWLERFSVPYHPSLKVSRVSNNLWAAEIGEELGNGLPSVQAVYYVAWYDGDYRIFTDPTALPADLLRDADYSAMPVNRPLKSGGGITPEGEDEFPPEDGQAEKWYREQQAELAAVKAAADKAVRALPEADTVISFDDPKVDLVDANSLDFIKIEPQGSKLLLYRVTYPTTADEILGPIMIYLDSEANVVGMAPRE